MKRLFVGIILLSTISAPALAARWIPYTDGRVGGCFQNAQDNLFGCTPQPSTRSQREEPQVIYRDRTDPRVDQLESENRALRYERDRQESIKREADAEQNRQAREILDYQQNVRQREQVARSAHQEQEWLKNRTGCNSPENIQKLKKINLQPHPTVKGICVPLDYKPGSGSMAAVSCPPCQ